MDRDDERPAAVEVSTRETVVETELVEPVKAKKHKQKKVKKMALVETPSMIMGTGGGEGGMGLAGGLGGGLVGGILGGALLNRGGLFGGGATEGVVTPAMLTAGLAGVTDALQNTSVMQTLGAIQGSIPLAEGAIQLALAGAVGELRTHLGQVENGIVAGQAVTNKAISDAIASSLAASNAVNLNVLTMGQANLVATKDSQFATQVAINASTKEILAALNTNVIADLQRQLTVSESRAQEDRLVGRQRETEIHITNTNTAIAAQSQAQLQAQQQAQLQIQTIALLQNLIGDTQAIRQGSVVFNSGTMAASGNQTAANTKVA